MSEPLARAAFETTAAERVDVAMRLADLSPALWRQRLVARVLLWAFAVAVCFVLLRWLLPGQRPLAYAAMTVVAAIVLGFWAPRAEADGRRRTLAKALREQLGDGRVPFTVTLHPDRIAADAGTMRLEVPWRAVRALRLEGPDIEVVGPGTIVVVRSRAFAGQGERDAFLALARRLAADASRT